MDSTMGRLVKAVASARFVSRRVALATVSHFADRRFALATASWAVISAKAVHIYAHLNALQTSDLLRWGLTFYAQDTVFLLLLRLLLDGPPPTAARWLRTGATVAGMSLVAVVIFLAVVSISFFVVAGLELHWRNASTAGDSSSWGMLLTGLATSVFVAAALVVVAGALQVPCYVVTGIALDIVKWPAKFMLAKIPMLRHRMANAYQHLPQRDAGDAAESGVKGEEDASDSGASDPAPAPSKHTLWLYVAVGVVLLVQMAGTAIRPIKSSLVFMSWTLPLVPFVDFAQSSPSLASQLPAIVADNRTAVGEPIALPWLPKDHPLPGFRDWYEANRTHYRAAADPLKISNLDDDLLPALRHKLANIRIRHVMLIKLEATRKDVFPFKKGGLIWDRLTKSFTSQDKAFPDEAYQRLATLTPTANFLTGDYDDGFEHAEQKRRGGLNFNNAHTTSTYTLKSLTGTTCGVTPLVVDFNLEQEIGIYQPCLPHIFNAFNNVSHAADKATDDFTSYRWKTAHMQSVTAHFDKQDRLMRTMGYADQDIITSEYLKSDKAKFGKVTVPDLNFFGQPEVVIQDYVRDIFASAKKNNERVFLSHLTSTTHHNFVIPEDEKYVNLGDDKTVDDLSHYANAVSYVDRWLAKVLDILEQEGVADETLVIFLGDHGLCLAEMDSVSTYANGNIGNFHVPFVISHPQLPHIDINDAVISTQVLPTILDILVESGSLSASESQVARDLVRNCEAQSLIRPLRKRSPKTGSGDWHVSLINPGGHMIAVRDSRNPNIRLIVPIVGNIEWRFTDITSDPHEEKPIVDFDYDSLLHNVEAQHSPEAAKWIEEAAFVTRWWIDENFKRWGMKRA